MYGSSNAMSWLMSAGVASVVLLLIAFIVAIILTVVVYKEFISGYSEKTVSFKDKATWGPFFRFERFLVGKILKALYIFAAIFTATVACVGVIIAIIAAAGVGSYNASTGIGTFFTVLLSDIVFFIVTEFLARIFYELQIMFITLCQNTADIRKKLLEPKANECMDDRVLSAWATPAAATAAAGSAGAASYQVAPQYRPQPASQPQAAPAPTAQPASPSQGTAQMPIVAQSPAADTSASESASWTCPKCGRTVNTGKFCGGCGAPRS